MINIVMGGTNRLELIGLQALLEKSSGREYSIDFLDNSSLVELDNKNLQSADIAILDYDSCESEIERLTRTYKSRFRDMKIVWVSDDNRDITQFRTISAGADGFAKKSGNDLIESIETVLANDFYFSAGLLMSYVKKFCLIGDGYLNPVKLSPREKQVYSLVQSGATNAQIAEALSISKETVRVHLRRIRKLLRGL
jgi:two-component system invasion response regulator UvrY